MKIKMKILTIITLTVLIILISVSVSHLSLAQEYLETIVVKQVASSSTFHSIADESIQPATPYLVHMEIGPYYREYRCNFEDFHMWHKMRYNTIIYLDAEKIGEQALYAADTDGALLILEFGRDKYDTNKIKIKYGNNLRSRRTRIINSGDVLKITCMYQYQPRFGAAYLEYAVLDEKIKFVLPEDAIKQEKPAATGQAPRKTTDAKKVKERSLSVNELFIIGAISSEEWLKRKKLR